MELIEFLKSIGVESVKNITLFEEAFTHRSYINEAKKKAGLSHNERLEFLGDAVLELIISQHLFETYSDRPEGELTSFRAASVRTESLANIARQLGCGTQLKMSKGEEGTGGREKDYLLANTFEALLGALYIDQGFEACKKFIDNTLVPLIPNIVENRLDIDPKTKFQELAQERYKVTPTYTTVSEVGPDHNKTFTMAVYINDEKMGEGSGASKQKAEEQAALKALENTNKKELLN